ncbi:hypothetical protein [Prochlorococcus sp. MIT 1227]|uniref:hypothetical protein n=1 Tax=Prochlorococcus sp. MIT 1227 TaxID=3082536 RepID=UPI0039A56A2C
MVSPPKPSWLSMAVIHLPQSPFPAKPTAAGQGKHGDAHHLEHHAPENSEPACCVTL